MDRPRSRRARGEPRNDDGACGSHGQGGDASCCRPAVVRAYRELSGLGVPDRFAFEAAVEVYRWHHPEVAAEGALETVSKWVWTGVSH